MIYFIRDHKSGFKQSKNIAYYFNQNFREKIELLVLYKYQLEKVKTAPEKFVVFIRNPREIIVSGYLYHQICSEPWAVKKGGNYFEDYRFKIDEDDIKFANDFSVPKSYQNKLKGMSQEEGLKYEMNMVGYLTLSGLNEILKVNRPNVFFLDMDQFTFNFEPTVNKLFKFLELPEDNLTKHFKNVLSIKVNLLGKRKITNHITNKELKVDRYKNYWNDELEKELNFKFPDLIKNYEDKIL